MYVCMTAKQNDIKEEEKKNNTHRKKNNGFVYMLVSINTLHGIRSNSNDN